MAESRIYILRLKFSLHCVRNLHYKEGVADGARFFSEVTELLPDVLS